MIAVLFDGAGLARLGLEQAGLECVGFEINPIAHHLSKFVGSGRSVLEDVRNVDLSKYEAVWASPPCQWLSTARTTGDPESPYSENLLEWSLAIPNRPLWVENVFQLKSKDNNWGIKWNAAQFLEKPIQNRNRIVGGGYPLPTTYSNYKKAFKGICPCVTATEFRGCKTDTRRASRFYGRKLTIEECAYHQGFEIPKEWWDILDGFSKAKWNNELYRAIGNGVPVYMARAFGEAYAEQIN